MTRYIFSRTGRSDVRADVKNPLPARRVALYFHYESFYRGMVQFNTGLEAVKKQVAYKGYGDEEGYFSYKFEMGNSNLLLPMPIINLDFKLSMKESGLSGEVSITARAIKGAGQEVNRALGIEANKRGLCWASSGDKSGSGYLIPDVTNIPAIPAEGRYEGYEIESLANVNCQHGGFNCLECLVGIGLEKGARATKPLRTLNDFKMHTAPLQWISETIINTYIASARRIGIKTLDERVSTIRINIAP